MVGTIRLANTSDAFDLAQLAESTFRDAFSEFNSTKNMDAHCSESYGKKLQQSEIENENRITLVVEKNQQLIAYAQLKWDKSPQCISANYPGEIQRLYVDKNYHGSGVSHELMDKCILLLQNLDKDLIWLGVWEHNPRAIAYYKKFGFVEVGEHKFLLGDDLQRDIIMARPSRLNNC